MNVKWRIKINGKEYRSGGEMPAAERDAYEKAVEPLANPGHGIILAGTSARIVFNGQEYANVDAMPEDVRQTYLNVMKTAEAGESPPGHAHGEEFAKAPPRPRIGGFGGFSRRSRPIAPESFSVRKLVVGAAIAALLAGLYFLARR